MLIVKDFEKLKAHGFKNYKYNIWIRTLEKVGNNDINLIVNPYSTKCEKNEMFIYASCEDENGMDMISNIDVVVEMIQDGTIEYVKK